MCNFVFSFLKVSLPLLFSKRRLSALTFAPRETSRVVSTQGEASVSMPPPRPRTSFFVDIEKLLPDAEFASRYGQSLQLGLELTPADEDPMLLGQLHYHVTGSFLYELRSEFSERNFVVALAREGRSLSGGVSEELADQPIVMSISML